MKRIKKMKEKDIRLALLFCMFTALAADILCVLFLIGYTGNFIYYNLEWLKGLISL